MTFKMGDLVVAVGSRAGRQHTARRAGCKGLVKAVEEADSDTLLEGDVVTVFWFDRMQDARERARYLKRVAA